MPESPAAQPAPLANAAGRGWSMTRRLVWSLSLSLSCMWLLGAGAAALTTWHELSEVFDDSLRHVAERLLPLAMDDVDSYEEAAFAAPLVMAAPATTREEGSYFEVQIRDRAGRLLMRSGGSPKKPFAEQMTPGFQDTSEHRVYTAVAANGSVAVQVADHWQTRNETIVEVLQWMLMPLLGLLPITALLIVWVIRPAMRPIGTISQNIAARDGDHLEPIEFGGAPERAAGHRR